MQTYHGSRNSGFTRAPYELMLVTSEEERNIKLLWVYSESIFNPHDIATINHDFKKLIEIIMAQSSTLVTHLLEKIRM